MHNSSRIKLLNFFKELQSFEEHKKEFTFDDIITDYKKSTLIKYLTTYLDGYCVKTKKNYWSCLGIRELSTEKYLQLMSQKNNFNQGDTELQRIQIRSKEAFLSSIAIYNNPLSQYRLESFLLLLINAWELLLKYEISTKFGKDSIYEENENTISITKCINKILKENDPIRINLEYAIDLRNKATHLIIPEMHSCHTRLLQPTVKNYLDRYKLIIEESPLKNSKGMINIIIDDHEIDLIKIKQKYGAESQKKIEAFINDIEQKSKEINSNVFFISFEYTYALIKKSNLADVTLASGENGELVKLLEKPISIEKKYPYKTQGIIDYINNNVEHKISSQSLYAINYEYDIKKKPEFFKLNENVPRYSQQFVEWFIREYLKDPDWLGTAKYHYSRSKKIKSKTSFKNQNKDKFISQNSNVKF